MTYTLHPGAEQDVANALDFIPNTPGLWLLHALSNILGQTTISMRYADEAEVDWLDY